MEFKMKENIKHIVCYSGGHSSALVAIDVVSKYGAENTILVNHDISSKVEDADIKRFKREIADYLNMNITYVNAPDFENRTPLKVSLEENAFKTKENPGLCTSRLKTKPFMDWLFLNFNPEEAVIYYGYDKEETTRITNRTKVMQMAGFEVVCPLAGNDVKVLNTEDLNILKPGTYGVFKHANCKGCLKAGKQHWYVVYCVDRELFEEAKQAEYTIGYSIIKGSYLKDLEPYFEKMRLAGIPATEHIPHQTFWAMVRKSIGKILLEDGKECVSCMV